MRRRLLVFSPLLLHGIAALAQVGKHEPITLDRLADRHINRRAEHRSGAGEAVELAVFAARGILSEY
jgi:hypothetical protein